MVQSYLFADHATVTVLPVTPIAVDAPLIRLPVDPPPDNGLREASFVMVDKATSIRAEKLGPAFGRLGSADMTRVDRALAVFLAIAL